MGIHLASKCVRNDLWAQFLHRITYTHSINNIGKCVKKNKKIFRMERMCSMRAASSSISVYVYCVCECENVCVYVCNVYKERTTNIITMRWKSIMHGTNLMISTISNSKLNSMQIKYWAPIVLHFRVQLKISMVTHLIFHSMWKCGSNNKNNNNKIWERGAQSNVWHCVWHYLCLRVVYLYA